MALRRAEGQEAAFSSARMSELPSCCTISSVRVRKKDVNKLQSSTGHETSGGPLASSAPRASTFQSPAALFPGKIGPLGLLLSLIMSSVLSPWQGGERAALLLLHGNTRSPGTHGAPIDPSTLSIFCRFWVLLLTFRDCQAK